MKSPLPPFANLRSFLQWWVNNAKNASCCYRATDEEYENNREAFNCLTCDLMYQIDGLWRENAEAWEVFHLLCGRTVRDIQLENWVLTKWTDGWPLERTLGLIDRLDLIGSVLEPNGTAQDRHRS